MHRDDKSRLRRTVPLALEMLAQVNTILALLAATAAEAAEPRMVSPCPNGDFAANGYQQCATLNEGESRQAV